MLLSFPAIAWDFDGTLIDHPNSVLMHEFILRHPEKQHHIITFRSHGYQNSIFHELREIYPDAPGRSHFVGVRNIPDRAWEKFSEMTTRRLMGRLKGPLTPWEEYYIEWKGMVCGELNLPVLVDDREAQVLPGCERYGIMYLHPDDFEL